MLVTLGRSGMVIHARWPSFQSVLSNTSFAPSSTKPECVRFLLWNKASVSRALRGHSPMTQFPVEFWHSKKKPSPFQGHQSMGNQSRAGSLWALRRKRYLPTGLLWAYCFWGQGKDMEQRGFVLSARLWWTHLYQVGKANGPCPFLPPSFPWSSWTFSQGRTHATESLLCSNHNHSTMHFTCHFCSWSLWVTQHCLFLTSGSTVQRKVKTHSTESYIPSDMSSRIPVYHCISKQQVCLEQFP